MTEQVISKQIQELLKDATRLTDNMYAMESIDIHHNPEAYELLSTDAALSCEKMTCKLRSLIYTNTDISKSEYLRKAGDSQGIHISHQNRILEIALPCLMPKRKRQFSKEFMLGPLYQALSDFTETNPIQKYTKCTVCFTHVCSRNMPLSKIRDYDNIELKHILDMITAFAMVDDSGLYCDVHNTTELGDSDCTRISIMDKDRFPQWLTERNNRL